jgi:hypothetical protein
MATKGKAGKSAKKATKRLRKAKKLEATMPLVKDCQKV